MALRYPKPDMEYYPTPPETVDRLLELIPIEPKWTYAEPCRGTARSFYDRMPAGSQWAELSEGVDYLDTPFEKCDVIITNPPFSLTQQFLEKSLTEAGVIIYLQRLNYLGSVKRKAFWKKHKPDKLAILSKRPSFSGDGATDGCEYAFYIWDKDNRLGLEDNFYWI